MISVSLIDYIGRIDDGVGVILSLNINDIQYELMYWFNRYKNFRLVIEDKFYKDYPHIKDIYKYDYVIDLLYHIDTNVLPPRDDIFKEFFY